MNIQKNVDLKKWSSWRAGGPAQFFYKPDNKTSLLKALNWAKQNSAPVSFLGGGTNVLISDNGVKGLVINLQSLTGFKEHIRKEKLYVHALAGTPKAVLMQTFLKHKLAPALFLCGLPGSTGGGIAMNAGTGPKPQLYPPDFPREFKDIINKIEIIKEGQMITIQSENIKWGYRRGWQTDLIYSAEMSWPLHPIAHLPELVRKAALRRAQTQPLQSASCGSVFKNPSQGQGAGALIEQCGLKGLSAGGACVSKKHANFIENTGHAKAGDIHQLIQRIQKTVQTRLGILLEPEVKYLGHWP